MIKNIFVFLILGTVVSGCMSGSGDDKQSKSAQSTASQQLVKRTPDDNCGNLGIKILEPSSTTIVSFPIIVTAEVNNKDAGENCRWTVFEAQAGSVSLTDSEGTLVSNGVLRTLDDWMSDGPVVYKAVLNLDKGPKSKNMTVTINEEKPSGETGQKLEFDIKLP